MPALCLFVAARRPAAAAYPVRPAGGAEKNRVPQKACMLPGLPERRA